MHPTDDHRTIGPDPDAATTACGGERRRRLTAAALALAIVLGGVATSIPTATAQTGGSAASSGTSTWGARAWYPSSPTAQCSYDPVVIYGQMTFVNTVRLTGIRAIGANLDPYRYNEIDSIRATPWIQRKVNGQWQWVTMRAPVDLTVGEYSYATAPEARYSTGYSLRNPGWNVFVRIRGTDQYQLLGWYPATLQFNGGVC